MKRLVDREQLRVVVQERLPLAEVARAFELVGSGRAQGKVVLTLD
ncbi:zinc-binding dehydrogenase [Kitasatospora sp. NPDC008050]